MDVDDFVPVRRKKRVTDQPHVARQHDPLRPVEAELFNDELFKSRFIFK